MRSNAPPVLSTICSGTKVNGRRAHSWEIELGGLAPQFELTSLPEIELQQLASLFTFLNPEAGSIPYTFNISRSILRGFSIIACATHEGDWIPKIQQIQQYIYVTWRWVSHEGGMLITMPWVGLYLDHCTEPTVLIHTIQRLPCDLKCWWWSSHTSPPARGSSSTS